jgi:hypothetical protein
MARLRFVLVVILLGATVIFAGGVTPAYAISCGDILGPGGNFQLPPHQIVISEKRSTITLGPSFYSQCRVHDSKPLTARYRNEGKFSESLVSKVL